MHMCHALAIHMPIHTSMHISIHELLARETESIYMFAIEGLFGFRTNGVNDSMAGLLSLLGP